MIRKAATAAALLAAFALALPGAAFAGDDPDGGDEPPPALRAEVERRIRTYRAISLAHRLDLDEEKALALSAAMQRYDDARRAVRAELFAHMQVVRRAAGGEAMDDAQIEAAVSGVLDARARLDTLRQEEARELMEGLDARQKAELVIFFREFPREIRRLMREDASERRPHRRGPGRRGP